MRDALERRWAARASIDTNFVCVILLRSVMLVSINLTPWRLGIALVASTWVKKGICTAVACWPSHQVEHGLVETRHGEGKGGAG